MLPADSERSVGSGYFSNESFFADLDESASESDDGSGGWSESWSEEDGDAQECFKILHSVEAALEGVKALFAEKEALFERRQIPYTSQIDNT